MSEIDRVEHDSYLLVWTIYDRPLDYPVGYVVRAWEVTALSVVARQDAQYAATLDEARALIPAGLVQLVRMADDDSTIVESWV